MSGSEPVEFLVWTGPEPTTFAQRMDVAHTHEERVIEFLRDKGYAVQPWGQGVFRADVREALRHTDSFVRWQPDVLAVSSVVMYVDAKAKMSERPNHSVEISAHRAHLKRMQAEEVPVVYVWPDWSSEIASRVVIKVALPGGGRQTWTAGSGTDFILIRKSDCRKFDDVVADVAAVTDWTAEATTALGSLDFAIEHMSTDVDRVK